MPLYPLFTFHRFFLSVLYHNDFKDNNNSKNFPLHNYGLYWANVRWNVNQHLKLHIYQQNVARIYEKTLSWQPNPKQRLGQRDNTLLINVLHIFVKQRKTFHRTYTARHHSSQAFALLRPNGFTNTTYYLSSIKRQKLLFSLGIVQISRPKYSCR